MNHKLKAIALALCAALTLSTAAAAAEANMADTEPEPDSPAQILYDAGLFRGTGTAEDGSPQFSLDRPATRMQGLILLLRMLGEEDDALACTAECPFTDLTGSSARYGAYAYTQGYTKGSSPTTFGNTPLKSNAFLTFALRALGYEDGEGKDFTYSTAFVRAAQAGIIDYGELIDGSRVLLREECARLCLNTLISQKKGSDLTLIDTLVADGAVDRDKVSASGLFSTQYQYGWDTNYETWANAYACTVAPYYDVTELCHTESPLTEQEMTDEIKLCFLEGNYRLHLWYPTEEAMHRGVELVRQLFHPLSNSYPELMGFYTNGDLMCHAYSEGEDNWYIDLSIADATLSDQELFRQQQVAFDAARALQRQLHREGILTEDMSQKEIAQACYDYLRALNIGASSTNYDEEDRGVYMQYDTVYAYLVNREADCLGRAAVYNLLMHLEGIPSQSVNGAFHGARPGEGHVLNRVVLDGQEYVCDFGNGYPLRSLAEMEQSFDFNPDSLALARARG